MGAAHHLIFFSLALEFCGSLPSTPARIISATAECDFHSQARLKARSASCQQGATMLMVTSCDISALKQTADESHAKSDWLARLSCAASEPSYAESRARARQHSPACHVVTRAMVSQGNKVRLCQGCAATAPKALGTGA